MKRNFPSVYKPLRIKAPPKISPSKRAVEKYKPWGLFSEFYGISKWRVHLVYYTPKNGFKYESLFMFC